LLIRIWVVNWWDGLDLAGLIIRLSWC
jgi:hypothetical protein